MSDDLPQRARERAGARGFPDADLLLDLARAIETLHSDNAKLKAELDVSEGVIIELRKEVDEGDSDNAKLREGLKPFVQALEDSDDDRYPDRCDIWEAPVAQNITFADLRRAKSLLDQETK